MKPKKSFIVSVLKTYCKSRLPDVNKAKDLLETLFEGEEINSKDDEEDLLWTLCHLIPIVVLKR